MRSYLISSPNELEDIKNQWDKIYFESGTENPFLCWEWNRLWISSFHKEGNVKVVVLEDEMEIVCIAPFSINNRNLTFLSDNFFADYMDLIINKPSPLIVQMVMTEVLKLKGWNKLSLLAIPEFSPCLEYFESSLTKSTFSASKESIHSNPFIDTTKDFVEYMASRSNGVRKELRRTKNKLEKTSEEWGFFEAQSDAEKEEVLDALVGFHLQRQVLKVSSSIFEDPKHVEFYKNLIKNKNIPWNIHLSGIRTDGKFVTASISIITGNVFYYWITAFDASLGGGSVGNLHVKFLAEKCFKEGFKRLDFMGGTEAYKMRWSNGSYNSYQITAYRSLLRLGLDKTWSYIRNQLQGLKDRSLFWNRVWVGVSKFVG
jgi:hypothetical protein